MLDNKEDERILRKQLFKIFILYSIVILGVISTYGTFIYFTYTELINFYIKLSIGIYVFMLVAAYITYKKVLLKGNPNLYKDLIVAYKVRKEKGKTLR